MPAGVDPTVRVTDVRELGLRLMLPLEAYPMTNARAFLCTVCGVPVIDVPRHEEWHAFSPPPLPHEPRTLAPADLFPPPEHRYLTDDVIESLRQRALAAPHVYLASELVLQLVCDWRNMAADAAS